MLANLAEASSNSGTLSGDVHKSLTFLREMLAFIASELPRWRDDVDRPNETSETVLTEHLCDFLSSAARLSPGWDVLQFRTEVSDADDKRRKLDLVPKPCGATIFIDGRRHTQYDPLMPIECKRLPTPNGKDRDEREYVFSQYSSTGGIQRFKAGHHGASHLLGAMIGYVQEETAVLWHQRIAAWISDLAESGEPGWTKMDLLELIATDESEGPAVLKSSHDRGKGREKIELCHLWMKMN